MLQDSYSSITGLVQAVTDLAQAVTDYYRLLQHDTMLAAVH